MAGIMKTLVLALCALSGAQAALNMNLRIGSGGRTLDDFRREVRLQHFTRLSLLSLHQKFLTAQMSLNEQRYLCTSNPQAIHSIWPNVWQDPTNTMNIKLSLFRTKRS